MLKINNSEAIALKLNPYNTKQLTFAFVSKNHKFISPFTDDICNMMSPIGNSNRATIGVHPYQTWDYRTTKYTMQYNNETYTSCYMPIIIDNDHPSRPIYVFS